LVGTDPAVRGRGRLARGEFESGVKGDDMKKSTIIVGILAVVWIAAGGALAGQNAITGKCVKVIDGDTLIVECEKYQRTVNIEGIDAPELDQPWGKEVRSFVRDMVRGENVEIEVIDSEGDSVIARVTVDGIDLSELLVSRGLAWVPEGSTDADLVGLSAKARELPCGLWMDPAAQPPWEFRAARG
jgi:micrococcal nuclease